MRRLILVPFIAALSAGLLAADKLNWHTQLKAGLKAASSSAKPVLLMTCWKPGT